MNPLTRKILFLFFVALFFIFAGATISYSLGWRFNAETITIGQVGGLYIKTQPKGVVIKLNNKIYEDKSGLLQSGTPILNLTPKTYELLISKDGYHDYKKTINIKPKMVEEVMGVVMVPKKIEPQKIYQVRGDKIIAISFDDTAAIIKNSQNGNFYLYELSNASSTLNLTAAMNAAEKITVKNMEFSPFGGGQFIADDGKNIKIFDTSKNSAETIIKGPVLIWTLNTSSLYYIKQVSKTNASPETPQEKSYALFYYSFIFRKETKILDIPEEDALSKIEKIEVSDSGSIAIADENGNLNLLAKNSSEFKKISGNINAFSFSPDGKMLSYISKNGTFKILFLEDVNGNIRKKQNEEIILSINQSADISSVFWSKNSMRLLLAYPKETILAEIDDRLPQNSYQISADDSSSLYSPKNDILYMIKEGIFLKIDLSKF